MYHEPAGPLGLSVRSRRYTQSTSGSPKVDSRKRLNAITGVHRRHSLSDQNLTKQAGHREGNDDRTG